MRLVMVSQVTGQGEAGEDLTTPTVVQADLLRSFYPRREGNSGTRLTFDDGGGWACAETYEEIKAKMVTAGVAFVDLTETKDAAAQIDEESGEVLNQGDERLSPYSVNPAHVRCFYPRKDNKVGTRLTFGKSAGVAVHDLFETVAAAFGAAARQLPRA